MDQVFDIERYLKSGQLVLGKIEPSWTPGIFLSKEGLFPLEDVAELLDLSTARMKAEAFQLEREGRSAFQTMGVRKIFDRWVVLIEVFGPYYLSNLVPRIRSVKSGWDANILLMQKGVFYLSDVCALIPFTTTQLRYQAQKNPKSKWEFGIWKDKELQTYLVEMEIFGPWLTHFWTTEVKGR